MTNLTNLNRDMCWIVPDQAAASLGTEDVSGAICSADGTVYDKHAFLHLNTGTLANANFRATGLMFTAPTEEAAVFRVRSEATLSGTAALVMGLGYLTAAPASGDNTLQGMQYYGYPIGALYDDVWAIRPSTLYANQPLCIFLGLQAAQNAQLIAKMSVQRMVGKPDNFASAVA